MNSDTGNQPSVPQDLEQQLIELIRSAKPYVRQIWEARWRLVFVNSAVFAATVALLLVFAKPYYMSYGVVLPEFSAQSNILTQLGGLASFAGVGSSTPTDIYQNIVRSEGVLLPVVYRKYKTEAFPDSVNLIEYFEIAPSSDTPPELRERDAFLQLFKYLNDKKIETEVDKFTKILRIEVSMPEAGLAADVTNALLESLDSYVRTKAQSQARQQRMYLDERTETIKDSLRLAEEDLKHFNLNNRSTQGSAELQLKRSRLERSVAILNSVYLQLAQQLEIARMEEAKDIPVISVRERALNPITKAGPRRIVITLVVMLFSVLLSCIAIILQDEGKRILGIITE